MRSTPEIQCANYSTPDTDMMPYPAFYGKHEICAIADDQAGIPRYARNNPNATQTPMCSVALPSSKFGIIAVKKLLATTNRPIKTISVSCGYTDLAYLKTLFKCHPQDQHTRMRNIRRQGFGRCHGLDSFFLVRPLYQIRVCITATRMFRIFSAPLQLTRNLDAATFD